MPESPIPADADASNQAEVRAALTSAFGPIADAAYNAIADTLQPVVTPGGAVLFEQGDPGDSVYVLIYGRLHVSISDAETGQKELLGEVLPGEAIGEIGLITGEPRTATLQAARDSLLLRIGRESFDTICEHDPAVLRRLAKVVVGRLGQRTARRRFSPRVSNISVVSTCRDAFDHRFAASLRDALEAFGVTRHLNEAGFRADLGEAADSDSEAARGKMTEWFTAQERDQRFVVYEAGKERNAWAHCCVRQADVVITVVDAEADAQPQLDAIPLDSSDNTHVRRVLILRHRSADAELRGTAQWLDAIDVDEHYHLRDGRPEDLARIARIMAGKAVGLVFGGGGARGFAHIGIYRALVERGIPVDWIGGTSMGSVFAAALAIGWSADEMEEKMREIFLRGKPMSGFTLPMISLLSPKRLERLLKQYFDKDIEDLPLPFYCVATNLSEAKIIIQERGSLAKAVRASLALPGVYPPAVSGNSLVIDGAILNNLPANIMAERPVGTVVAVSLVVQKEHKLSYDTVPSVWRVLASRLPFSKRLRVPNILILMLKATEIGSIVHARETRSDSDILLTPPVGRFGLLDAKAYDKLVRLGYDYAIEQLDGEAGEQLRGRLGV